MSDTATTATAPVTPPPVITRNGSDKTLKEFVFGKKSNFSGHKFFAPETSVADLSKDLPWYSENWVVDMVNRVSKKVFGDIYIDMLDTDEYKASGKFPWDQWKKDAEDFTAGVAKLGDLLEEIDELQGIQQTLAQDPKFELDADDNPTPDYTRIAEQMKEIAKKIKPLRNQVAAIKAKYQERADKREAKKQAAEAATAKTAGTVTAAA